MPRKRGNEENDRKRSGKECLSLVEMARIYSQILRDYNDCQRKGTYEFQEHRIDSVLYDSLSKINKHLQQLLDDNPLIGDGDRYQEEYARIDPKGLDAFGVNYALTQDIGSPIINKYRNQLEDLYDRGLQRIANGTFTNNGPGVIDDIKDIMAQKYPLEGVTPASSEQTLPWEPAKPDTKIPESKTEQEEYLKGFTSSIKEVVAMNKLYTFSVSESDGLSLMEHLSKELDKGTPEAPFTPGFAKSFAEMQEKSPSLLERIGMTPIMNKYSAWLGSETKKILAEETKKKAEARQPKNTDKAKITEEAKEELYQALVYAVHNNNDEHSAKVSAMNKNLRIMLNALKKTSVEEPFSDTFMKAFRYASDEATRRSFKGETLPDKYISLVYSVNSGDFMKTPEAIAQRKKELAQHAKEAKSQEKTAKAATKKEPAFNGQKYLKEFAAIMKDLRKTDSTFSKDSPEYKAFKSELFNAVKNLEGKDMVKVNDVFGKAFEAANNYRKAHMENKTLSDRQIDRLKVMARLENLCRSAAKNPENPDKCFEERLAEKIVTGKATKCLANGGQKIPNEETVAYRNALLNPSAMEEAISNTITNGDFSKAVAKMGKSHDELLHCKGTVVYESYNKELSAISQSRARSM